MAEVKEGQAVVLTRENGTTDPWDIATVLPERVKAEDVEGAQEMYSREGKDVMVVRVIATTLE